MDGSPQNQRFEIGQNPFPLRKVLVNSIRDEEKNGKIRNEKNNVNLKGINLS